MKKQKYNREEKRRRQKQLLDIIQLVSYYNLNARLF